MYFPYLFGKRGELIAIRELSGPHGRPQVIWPVVEPVKTATGSLVITLETLRVKSAGIYLVVNPSQDEFSAPASPSQLNWHATFAPYIADPGLVRPTFLQTAATSASDLRAFASANPNRPIGVVLTTDDIAPSDVASSLGGTNHVVFLHRDVSRALYESVLGISNTVDIESNFVSRPRNVDYAGTDSQGKNHLNWASRGKAGFSDYTVLPGAYRDTGGGAMGALVIHLSYETPTEIRVQHFVSTTVAQADPLATKFFEAIAAIEAQIVATPARFRRSPGLAEFLRQQLTGGYTNPEGNKRQQIAHHIFTIGKGLGL